MKNRFSRGLQMFTVIGALTLIAPFTVNAESAPSDSEKWNQGQAELQKNLPPGMSADAYEKKLKDLGYQVTSTNYNNDDYLEYEIVKGDQTWEVQINVNKDTHKATSVDIASNTWKTDATKAALAHSTPATHDTASASHRQAALRNNQYSDRDRASTDQLVRELEAMPVGKDKQFYKDSLSQKGYDIARIDTDDTDELKLEAVKGGNSVKMDVDFDKQTGRSTSIDASSLWAESESTSQTRKAQESRMERHNQAD
jgi:uncharacterized protein YmfQ (DUF2313 family)